MNEFRNQPTKKILSRLTIIILIEWWLSCFVFVVVTVQFDMSLLYWLTDLLIVERLITKLLLLLIFGTSKRHCLSFSISLANRFTIWNGFLWGLWVLKYRNIYRHMSKVYFNIFGGFYDKQIIGWLLTTCYFSCYFHIVGNWKLFLFFLNRNKKFQIKLL